MHVFNVGGHRSSYQTFLASQLRLTPVVGQIDWTLAARFFGARQLLLATIGPTTSARAILVAVARACFGKRTVAICMGRDWYEQPTKPRLSALVFGLFRFLDARDKLKVFVIIPHELMPEAAATTSGSVLDLCLWDQLDADTDQRETSLSNAAKDLAAGRPIVVYLGKASRRKGYGELVALAERVRGRALIVSAGVVAPECEQDAVALRESGMMVEDRRVSEGELTSLYGVADYVWCHYAESSNELSSGIFGRALQFGKSVVVRPGSYLDRLANYLEYPVLHDLAPELERGIGELPTQTGPIQPGFPQKHERLRQMASESMELLRCSL